MHGPRQCDDGDVCNGAESCDAALGCVQGVPLPCNDGLACTGAESCDPAQGCKPGTPPAQCCNTDSDCATADVCQGDGLCELGTGTCVFTPPPASSSGV